MTDMEKVINVLSKYKKQVFGDKDEKVTVDDIIDMLKAQEPMKPTIGGDADGPCGNWWYQCGKCKEAIDYHDKYCRTCGQAVKWE